MPITQRNKTPGCTVFSKHSMPMKHTPPNATAAAANSFCNCNLNERTPPLLDQERLPQTPGRAGQNSRELYINKHFCGPPAAAVADAAKAPSWGRHSPENKKSKVRPQNELRICRSSLAYFKQPRSSPDVHNEIGGKYLKAPRYRHDGRSCCGNSSGDLLAHHSHALVEIESCRNARSR